MKNRFLETLCGLMAAFFSSVFGGILGIPGATRLRAGFAYTIEVVSRSTGEVLSRETVHNLMPDEGVTHALSVLLKGGTQVTNWYIGLFEGNYTPNGTDTMAEFPAAADESDGYTETARQAFTPGAISAGAVTNVSSRAEFSFTDDATIYGGFISSTSVRGSTSGVLISAVRFNSPKSVSADSVLRVTAGFTLTSV